MKIPADKKASIIISQKLHASGGQSMISSLSGKVYKIEIADDGVSFLCDQLPVNPPYTFSVFDIITELLLENNGKSKKGNGHKYKLGEGNCTEDTVVGAIGKNYFHKTYGESVYDPVFVLAAILEWADIAHNRRGYLELTASYLAKLKS